MSIQNIQSTAQNSELYQIHKKTEAHNEEQLQAEQQASQVQVIQQSDEYDTANPVGEEAEGIYSVSYDDEGNLQVNYIQPGGNSSSKAEGVSSGGSAGQASAAEAAEESEESDDDTEEEIEKLKKQRDQIRQQLNKEQDENVKKSLRAQLQMIEAQIAQLTSQQNSSQTPRGYP